MQFRLFRHPRIYTMSKKLPVAKWMLTCGEQIVISGDTKSTPQFPGHKVETIRLPGACVVPGFIDAHVHLGRSLSLYAQNQDRGSPWAKEVAWIDLHEVNNLEGLQNVIHSHVQQYAPGTWIVGGNWHPLNLAEKLTCQHIDQLAPRHPVLLIDYTLHSALANSVALQLAEIGEDTWAPRGGMIDRDAHTGQVTGWLYEYAVSLVENKIPPMGQSLKQNLVLKAMSHLNSLGIVGIHDLESCPEHDMFSILAKILTTNPEKFTVRCLCALQFATLQQKCNWGVVPHMGSEYLRVGPLKLIHDGSLGAQTALMTRPYKSGCGVNPNWGREVLSQGEIQHIAHEACLRRIPVAIHALGDRATENIAQVFEHLGYGPKYRPLRHRIEHVQSATPQTIRRLAKCGVVFSIQPLHLLEDMPRIANLQPHLVKHTHTYRTIVDCAAKFHSQLALGTDFPVVDPVPLKTIYTAITHKGGQQLSIMEALYAHTMGGAFAAAEESRKGSLESGKLADFVVLSKDIVQTDPQHILATEIVATYLGANQVFPKV